MKLWVDAGNDRLVVFAEDGSSLTKRVKQKLSVNELEYLAMLEGIKYAKDGDIIYSDSKLVVSQLFGWFKINHNHLRMLCEQCNVERKNKKVGIFWIPRKKNEAGKLLANQKWKRAKNKTKI